MGREIRRVPLDFDWPLQKIWKGFINPHYRSCPEAAKNNCHQGSTNAERWLYAIAKLISLVGKEGARNSPDLQAKMEENRCSRPDHSLQEWEFAPYIERTVEEDQRIRGIEDKHQRRAEYDRFVPRLVTLDSDIAEVVMALAKGEIEYYRGPSPTNIYRTLLEAAGITDPNWDRCKVCNGEGIDPDFLEAYENWEKQPPPEGEGWQLWETTSEGSPISPVLPTEEAFVNYLVDQGYSVEAAQAFAKIGWAATATAIPNENGEMVFRRDIESCG